MPWPGLTPSEERREALGIAFRSGYETRRRGDMLIGAGIALLMLGVASVLLGWF